MAAVNLNYQFSKLKATVSVRQDCADGRADGYYADPESGCRSYFYCAGGHRATYVCPASDVFNGSRCVHPAGYKCPFESSADCRSLLSASDGYHADPASGCRKYFFCSGDGHKLMTLTCADGRLFDGKKCVDPDTYRCPSPDASGRKQSVPFRFTPTTTAIPGESGESGNQCGKGYGFFVIRGTGCRNYSVCVAGSPRADLQCAGDTLFNGDICVDPDQFVCPELSPPSAESSPNCRDKPDGIYPAAGCRNYFLCLNGLPTNFTCPDGQLFDGRRCADRRKVTCPFTDPAGSLPTACTGRKNGLVAEESVAGCRHYVYCRSGRPYGPVGHCSGSERFSQEQSRCLPKYQVECRTPEDDSENNGDMDEMLAEPSDLVTSVDGIEIGEEMASTTSIPSASNLE